MYFMPWVRGVVTLRKAAAQVPSCVYLLGWRNSEPAQLSCVIDLIPKFLK